VLARLQPIHENLISIITVIMIVIIMIIISKQKNTWQNVLARPIHENRISKYLIDIQILGSHGYLNLCMRT